MRAAVDRLPDAAARPALQEVPRGAGLLPHGGVEDLRPARILDEVDRARAVVDVEDPRPGLAAVRRLVDAALRVVRVEVAGGGDVDGARIARVHEDASDVVRIGEAQVAPGLPAVRRLEDAGARGGGQAGVALSA